MSKSLAAKVQTIVDGYHPHLALRDIKRKMENGGGKRVWDRLFELVDSEDENVALKAINTILGQLGTDKFLDAQIAIAKEQALNEVKPATSSPAGEDPEEDERVARRARVLKTRAAPPAEPGSGAGKPRSVHGTRVEGRHRKAPPPE